MSSQQVYDLDGLRSFLRDQAGVTGPIEVTGRAPGGSSNITLFLTVDGERWVLRRPPIGELLPTAHDMLREYRFLRAIHGTSVPVAEPLVACPDPTVIGAPFYTMRYVDGVLLSTAAKDPGLARPDECRAITAGLIQVLADLHGLDWAALGLAGKPTGFLRRQVRRWTEQLTLTPTAARLGPASPGGDRLDLRQCAGVAAREHRARRLHAQQSSRAPTTGHPGGRRARLGNGDHRRSAG